MFCSNCGNKINDGASFCPYCGNKISAGISQPFENSVRDGADDTTGKHGIRLIVCIIIAIVIAIVITGIAIYACSPSVKARKQLALGDKYLDQLEYEQAIAAFEEASEIDPKNPESYIGIAKVYKAQNNYEEATNTLNIAIEYVDKKDASQIKTALKETSREQKEYEDIQKENEAAAFKSELSELVSQYGIFNDKQSAIVDDSSIEWLDPQGVMSANVMDFDNDGASEMLVFYSKPCTQDETMYSIMMDMYEFQNGVAELADSTIALGYVYASESASYGDSGMLCKDQGVDVGYCYNIANVNGENLILCQDEEICSLYCDGVYLEYWAMAYNGTKFQYRFDYAQNGPESDGFEYYGYEFKDGDVSNKKLCYSQYDDPSSDGSGYAKALTEYFKQYGVSTDVTNDSASIYQPQKGLEQLLSLQMKGEALSTDEVPVHAKVTATLTVSKDALTLE